MAELKVYHNSIQEKVSNIQGENRFKQMILLFALPGHSKSEKLKAAIALLGVIIFFMVWKSPLKPLENSLAEVKDNHLHELPAMAESLREISTTLQRMEVKIGEEFSYLKAKINGR